MAAHEERDLGLNFIKMLAEFRRHDLKKFCQEHDRLYKQAKETGEYKPCTTHYYGLMSHVIDDYFGGSFHFVPPEKAGQSRKQMTMFLHRQINEMLQLKPGMHLLDLGCGVGGAMVDLCNMSQGGKITGITIAPNEAEVGNARFVKEGLSDRCEIVVGDCYQLPMEDETFDAVYAVYALKYVDDLNKVFQQVQRVLKPNGLFLIYDILKTEKYDPQSDEQRDVIEGLEYVCGMPPLHTADLMDQAAMGCGMQLVNKVDLEEQTGRPYHSCFSNSRMLMGMFESSVVDKLIKIGQTTRIVPKGFAKFNKTFLSGTVVRLVKGGQMGILNGSTILAFAKYESEQCKTTPSAEAKESEML